MLRPVLRWTLILGTLLALGPLLARLAMRLHDVEGGHATTLTVNASPGLGAAVGLAALAGALAVGWLGAHFFSLGTGLTCAGIALAWTRWGLGTIDDIVRVAHGSGDFPRLAFEGVTLTLLAMGIAFIVCRAARRAHPPAPGTRGASNDLVIAEDAPSNQGLVCLMTSGAGLLLAGAVVWIAAASNLRGQTLLAVVAGGVAAGAAGQVVAGSMRVTLTPLLPMGAIAVLALLGPFLATWFHGAKLEEALYAGKLLGLARPTGFDWAAGALIGVPIGLSWAGAMLDPRAAEDPPQTHASPHRPGA